MKVNKQKCLVFGGSGALGSEVCRKLAEENCDIAFTYFKSKEKATKLEAELKNSRAYYCDLNNITTIENAIKNAAEYLSGINAIIQTAGISGRKIFYSQKSSTDFDRLQEIKKSDFDEIIEVNTKGSFYICQMAQKVLKETNGNIVIVGSIDGIKIVPSPVHFSASKSALKGMVESLSKELGKDNIKVNLIAPGILEGGQSNQLSEEIKQPYLTHCALKRFGTMREIAEVIAWFALENTYITGQSILLDGGL